MEAVEPVGAVVDQLAEDGGDAALGLVALEGRTGRDSRVRDDFFKQTSIDFLIITQCPATV